VQTKLPRATDKRPQILEPTGFAYVGRSRCGHVTYLAVEPHLDDLLERKSLYDDLRHYFLKGSVERVERAKIPDLNLCDCARKP
jgi:hypothetical protein